MSLHIPSVPISKFGYATRLDSQRKDTENAHLGQKTVEACITKTTLHENVNTNVRAPFARPNVSVTLTRIHQRELSVCLV